MTEDDLFRMLVEELQRSFGLDPATVTRDADLRANLDIDSIDAVDLAVRLEARTGKKLAPEEFRSIRTVRDLLRAIHEPTGA
jgi:acyl carrier protein